MAINKVIYGGTTIIDLTADTVTAAALKTGITAHDKSGNKITGTFDTASGSVHQDEEQYVVLNDDDDTGVAFLPLTVTSNGTYTASANTGYTPVTVNVNTVPTLQSKTVTPTESSQTVSPDSGYDGLSKVTVNAISSTYVGTGITTRTSTNLTVNGSTVTAPSGYYAAAAAKNVGAGTATTPATTLTFAPAISVNSSTGVVTATVAGSSNITPTVTAGYVTAGTSGKITVSGSNTLSLTTKAGATITPTETAQTAVNANVYTLGAVSVAAISSTYVGTGITTRTSTNLTVNGSTVTAPAGYYSAAAAKNVGAGTATTPATTLTFAPAVTVNTSTGVVTATVSGSSNITPTVTAGYVTAGTSGKITVSGSNTLSLTTRAGATITPTEAVQTAVSAGRYTTGDVKIAAISSTYVGTGVSTRNAANLTANGSTVTVPAGYYSSQVSKAITAGTATTPATTLTFAPAITVATNGTITATVSGSSSVTPTVTAGYVAAGTSGKITVSGTSTKTLSTRAATTITPTTASQLAVSSGYYTTGSVYVGAIPSAYVVPTGTLTISSAGTYNVTNYASANVTVSDDNFVVALSYNSNNDLWIPDKTLAEISAAYSAGKELLVSAVETYDWGESWSWECSCNYESGVFYYNVLYRVNHPVLNLTFTRRHFYYFDSSGVHSDGYEDLSNILAFPTKTITANGTYSPFDDSPPAAGYSAVTVNVPSSASAWEFIASKEITVSTSSTSTTTLEWWDTGYTSIWTSDKTVYIRIRDKAGKRAGYFYGTDNYWTNHYPIVGGSASTNYGIRNIYRYNASGKYAVYNTSSSTGYGVFVDSIEDTGSVRVEARYSSSYSLTIDGTYTIEVYLLSPPTGKPYFT